MLDSRASIPSVEFHVEFHVVCKLPKRMHSFNLHVHVFELCYVLCAMNQSLEACPW